MPVRGARKGWAVRSFPALADATTQPLTHTPTHPHTHTPTHPHPKCLQGHEGAREGDRRGRLGMGQHCPRPTTHQVLIRDGETVRGGCAAGAQNALLCKQHKDPRATVVATQRRPAGHVHHRRRQDPSGRHEVNGRGVENNDAPTTTCTESGTGMEVGVGGGGRWMAA
jgi:hypothetical protein